jgi:hypothetical protein
MKVLPLSLRTIFAVVLLLSFLRPTPAGAYSVLSHEEVVDMAWLPHIVPLLRARFPNLTDDEITKAHAYAYGGSVIQDIGYYPFGSHQFSDLLHYVRTGDFVSNLIRESTNVNEYAFALGALAHYCGDVVGHPAVNSVTSDEYPKLRRRFGMIVTYDQDKVAHLRTEFGFDVVQVAHGRYSQQNYRDFIGFQVSKELLERAFQETYGIPVDSVMKHEDLAISSYRHAVSSLIPNVTTVALVSYKDQIEKENPGFDRTKFLYRLKRTEFDKEYGKQYAHPGVGSHVLAFFIRILPKVGPLKVFRLQIPNADEQDVYLKSINGTVDKLNGYLANVKAPGTGAAVPAAMDSASPLQKAPDLAEIDLDTGKPSQFGEYHLADLSYASLLDTLLHDPKTPMKPDVYESFRDFYSNRKEPVWYVKKRKDWKRLQADLVLFDALPKPVVPPAAIAMVSSPTQH